MSDKEKRSVTLTGQQLKAALEFVAPDHNTTNPDQLETECTIEWFEATSYTDGEDKVYMPEGYYVYLTEYQEEGRCLLPGQGKEVTCLRKKTVANTQPVITGTHGSVWETDLSSPEFNQPGMVPTSLSVAHYIVSAEWAHPVWSHYFICCVHLRDVEGVPAANIALEGATHEVMVFALDPSAEIPLDTMPTTLRPINFSGQFIAASDEDAKEKIEEVVLEIINGKLSPDTDFISEWVKRFSDSNLKKGGGLWEHGRL